MKLIALIIIIFFNIADAYAYLDPATGSILLQALVFIFASITTGYIFFKNKIESLFKKLFKKKQEKNDKHPND